MGKLYFMKNFLRGKVLRQNFLRKLIREKFCTKNFYRRKSSWAKTFHRGKLLSEENFHGETFIQKTSTGISSHPQKLSGTEERGTVPEKMEFGWCLFWIMTILKILEIHHPTQLYKGKVRNDCRLYSGQGKLLQGKLIFRKTFWSKLIFQKTSSARRQSPC